MQFVRVPTLRLPRYGFHRLMVWIGVRLHAMFSLGTLEPPTDTNEGDEALLGAVEEALASTAYGAKFGTLIEQRYKSSTARPRGRLFVRLSVTGLTIYNLFLFVDMAVVPDVLWLVVPLQLFVVTPFTLGCMVVISYRGVDPEMPSAVCVGIMVALAITMFMLSESPHVDMFACLFGLFLISANVALAMSFATSLAFTLLCVGAVTTAIVMHPLLDLGDRVFSIAMLVATATYTLAGSYRIESGMRST